MKVLFTDTRMPEIGLERKFFADAGIELKVAQCATEEEVIRESEGCGALLITYAKVGDKVFSARPGIGLCSRIGEKISLQSDFRHAGVGKQYFHVDSPEQRQEFSKRRQDYPIYKLFQIARA